MTSKDNTQEKSFWLPLFVIVIGAFSAILNNSSVNVAIPELMSIFGVSESEIQWVLTAYMLTSGVVIPITGFLGDKFGTKRLFITALGIFTAGSVLCATAWNTNSLIAFRVLQGIGGGAIMPVSMAIIYRIVPRDKIGMALGFWGMAAIMGPAIGPTLGGYLIEHSSWRFLFVSNVPVGVLGVILCSIILEETPKARGSKFDFWGFLLSTTGLFALLLALSEAPGKGWDSFFIVMLLTFSFFSLLLFIIVELSIDQPMLDLRLLKNTTFTLSIVTTAFLTVGLFGGIFLIPLFTQNLMGLTALKTGLILMPAALITGALNPVSGFLFDRFGVKPLGITGITILGITTWELQNLSLDTSAHYITALMMVRSVGIGLAMMPVNAAGMNVVSKHLVGRASSLMNVFRQVSASFGVAILTVIIQNRQNFHYTHLSETVTSSSSAVQQVVQKVQGLSGGNLQEGMGTAIMLIMGAAQKKAMVMAIDDTFLVASLFAFAAIPPLFFFKEKSKKEPSSGGQATGSRTGAG